MIWTIAALDTSCGSCRVAIPKGEPLALLSAARLPRCVACAGGLGFAPDWTEIDLERFRLEHEAAAAEPARVTRPAEPRRLPPVKAPLPFSAIAETFFDRFGPANSGGDD